MRVGCIREEEKNSEKLRNQENKIPTAKETRHQSNPFFLSFGKRGRVVSFERGDAFLKSLDAYTFKK